MYIDFAALLTKKTSSNGQHNGANLAEMATGRFSFQKRHLYFSLVLPSPEADAGRPPRYLQFLSEDGNILEEQELATNDYYNATGKVAIIIIFLFFLTTGRRRFVLFSK